jgi:hypothetical protein
MSKKKQKVQKVRPFSERLSLLLAYFDVDEARQLNEDLKAHKENGGTFSKSVEKKIEKFLSRLEKAEKWEARPKKETKHSMDALTVLASSWWYSNQ